MAMCILGPAIYGGAHKTSAAKQSHTDQGCALNEAVCNAQARPLLQKKMILESSILKHRTIHLGTQICISKGLGCLNSLTAAN